MEGPRFGALLVFRFCVWSRYSCREFKAQKES
jgi:hypothetical protein